MAIPAKYAGNCPDCGGRYEIGTMIAKLPGGWGHDVCPAVPVKADKGPETASKAVVVTPANGMKSSVWEGFTPSEYQASFLSALTTRKTHIVLEAVAGSGKTSSICWALDNILNASLARGEKLKALFLAFNRSIAQELGSRVPRGCEASTLNSCGARMLARNGFKLEPENSQAFKLYRSMWPTPTRDKATQTEERQKNKALESACITLYNRCRQSLVEPSLSNLAELAFRYSIEGWQEDSSTIAERVTTLLATHSDAAKAHYASKNNDSFAGDFDDQIWLPYVLNLTDNSYDIVVVDEAQDLSASQVDLVLRLLTPWGRVVAVGDPRQAIYGFRGAGITSMEDLTSTLRASKLGCETLPLSVCYRCPTEVLDFLKYTGFGPASIEAAPNAPKGEVAVKRESELLTEVKGVLTYGGQPEACMLLSSLNAPLVPAVLSLIRANIPARIQGRDASKGVRALIEDASKSAGDKLSDMVLSAKDITEARVAKATERQEPTEEYTDVLETLLALVEGVDTFDALFARIDSIFTNADGEAKGVLASTVHRAKGLERDHVFILRPDALPVFWCKAEWEFKQAENCAYVALTRPKKRLVLLTGDKGLSMSLKSAWNKLKPKTSPIEDFEPEDHGSGSLTGTQDYGEPEDEAVYNVDYTPTVIPTVAELFDKKHEAAEAYKEAMERSAKVDLDKLPSWPSKGDGVFTPPTKADWEEIRLKYEDVGCYCELHRPVGWNQLALDIYANGKHIRVSTTVDTRGGEARDKGQNAIDVVLLRGGKMTGGATKVLRRSGWRGRVAERIRQLLERS